MDEVFQTKAEKMAVRAENLSAFRGVKLLAIRDCIAQLLDLIGRNEIFDEYTRHDISHVDEMLRITEWVIPESTQRAMSPADWLMLVLSIYFHDLGMLVTKSEYASRNTNAAFADYKKKVDSGEYGKEFKAKLESLGDAAERFLYQEYVRENHARRIRQWIVGEYGDLKGTSAQAPVDEINKALGPLPYKFKRDLARICESHHLDDLDDFKKYPTHVLYGNDDAQAVNLQYIAVILRTADLLHITSDRTPSTQFAVINPNDPKSLIEWQKQRAVKAVLPKTPRDKDGNVDNSLEKNTIEITADFDKPDQAEAFFGLDAYIMYMRQEIKRNYDWIQKAIRVEGTRQYLFPWEKIDADNIETFGFEPSQLEFTVDQASILQMLVGHTLYNDSSVALRELVQNGIDAVKLQHCIDTHQTSAPAFVEAGEVRIEWDEQSRTLTVSDNGTGMIVEEIKSFLLKVGVSKYRSESFMKQYPNFSAISRFGIGILTCFMIADDIDITTNSPEEEMASIISLRNVNGKYLLKKVDKDSVDPFIRAHGTSLSLHVRADFDSGSILEAARKWIVFPRCKVTLVKGGSRVNIGFRSPKDAVTQLLADAGIEVDGRRFRVGEEEQDGVTLAYALRYNPYFREWEFVTFGDLPRSVDDVFSPIGTCIEGIRVEFGSPGYDGKKLIAAANTLNRATVLTNVARSAVEDNGQKESLLSAVYGLYLRHCQTQMEELRKNGNSLSWAANECGYLLAPLFERETVFGSGEELGSLQNEQVFRAELRKLRCIVVEENRARSAVSVEGLADRDSFCVVDSRMVETAESFLIQTRSDSSLSALMAAVQADALLPADKPVLCSFSSGIIRELALEDWEVSSITVSKEARRADLVFSRRAGRWLTFELNTMYVRTVTLHFPVSDIEIEGLSEEFGLETISGTYLSKKHPLTQYLLSQMQKIRETGAEDIALLSSALLEIAYTVSTTVSTKLRVNADPSAEELQVVLEFIDSFAPSRLSRGGVSRLWELLDKKELARTLIRHGGGIYRPSDWSRKEE